MKDIIYLDNAATTAMKPIVVESMLPYLTHHYGNPSSSYTLGRQTKMAIESSRKQVAEMLGVKPITIFFTSGGTESNNTAIAAAVGGLKCTHIITSAIEHHAVLHAVDHYCKDSIVTCSYVKLKKSGAVDLLDLEEQLSAKSLAGVKCLVSLMHANNEVGILLDIEAAGLICRSHGAVFHSDCVQTIGHYPINLASSGVNFASASGHKFHGPKGTGILYASEDINFEPLIHGGGQERKHRAGTENVAGIVGFTRALSIALENHVQERPYISQINDYMRSSLRHISNQITFNSTADSLYTILSVNFPAGTDTDLMLALLDRKGICVSGGSACNSGDTGSHVLKVILGETDRATLRFSFSSETTIKEIDHTLEALRGMLEASKPHMKV